MNSLNPNAHDMEKARKLVAVSREWVGQNRQRYFWDVFKTLVIIACKKRNL